MPLHLILLGPPASGKGTQGRALAEQQGLDYLSTGALLREVLSDGGELAEKIRPILDRGGYISDEVMCEILGDWLAKHSAGWVLDGFPRTLAQDDFLQDWLASHDMKLDAAVALDVPKEELIRRMEERVECPICRWSGQRAQLMAGDQCPECEAKASRRADDTLENFLNRHDEYARLTVPVIERHQAQGSLLVVDATQPIDQVKEKINRSVDELKEDGQAA